MASGELVATIDLGSNSFHMQIARVLPEGGFELVDRHKRKVQLRAGLQLDGGLSEDAQDRALTCLREFHSILARYGVSRVRAVGTYTLRSMTDSDTFLTQANAALGYPIDVIDGHEEARLIYVGATVDAPIAEPHLIIDIGGGSTELILGAGTHISDLTSLDMGCVSVQNRFYPDDIITPAQQAEAHAYALEMIAPVASRFSATNWTVCLGASGTVQALMSIVRGWHAEAQRLSFADLDRIATELCELGSVDQIAYERLRPDRRNILPGGLSILRALFEALAIPEMALSRGAIREGILHELMAD